MTKQVIMQNLEDVATFGRNDASLLGQFDYWLKKANKGLCVYPGADQPGWRL